MIAADAGQRTRTVRRLAAGLAVALVAASCSSGGDDGTSPTDPPPSTGATTSEAEAHTPSEGSDLADIGFAESQVAPFDRVELTGLAGADATAGLELRLRTADGDVGLPLYTGPDGARFAAPLHPLTPYDGGSVELYLARDDEIGPLLEIAVDPLESSPGAWDEFITAFRDAIDRGAANAGSSFADLQATAFDDVSPSLLPLKIAQGYVDDGSDHDLESLPDHGELTDDDRAALDDVVGQLDLIRLVRPPEEPNGFRRPGPPTAPSPTSVSGAPAGRARVAPRSVTATAPEQSAGDCIDPGIEISDAADLAAKITTARDNTIMEGGAEEEVLDGIGSATTAGGFIPGVGWGIAGVGAGFLALEAYLNGTAGLYPSSITNLDAKITDPVFPEDFQADGFWQDVEVTARSTGWQADADVAATLLAAASAATAGAANLDVAEGFLLDVQLYLRDNVTNAAVQANAEANGGVLNFCSQEWTVDVTGEPWSTGRAVLERFEVDSAEQSYRPIETGLTLPVDDTLRIEIDPDQFAGLQAFEDHTIEVRPILVSAPDEVEVDEPGDDVDIDVDVANALDAELDWDAGEGGWQGDAQLLAAGDITGAPARWRRTHVSSSTESDFPYLVVVESTASAGLRADGEPPRNDVVEVVLKQLIVTPEDGRVLTKGSLQFQARDRNGDDVDVDWTATGGSIGPDGLYTAGDVPGIYEVTATSKDDSDLTDTVNVEVVEADCVVGDWRLREQDFLNQLAALVPQAGTFTHKGGQYVFTFAEDGAYTGRRQQWTIGIGTPAGEIDALIDSVESGTWTVDTEAELLAVEESSSTATVTLLLEGMTLPGGQQETESTAVSGQGAYTCEEDLLVVTITQPEGTITATFDRIG